LFVGSWNVIFSDVRTLGQLCRNDEMLSDGLLDVLQSYLLGPPPCDQQPASPGTEALKPSSDARSAIL